MDSNWNWKQYLFDGFIRVLPSYSCCPRGACCGCNFKMAKYGSYDDLPQKNFMSHIANCQLPKNMETKHLNLTFSMLEICFSLHRVNSLPRIYDTKLHLQEYSDFINVTNFRIG